MMIFFRHDPGNPKFKDIDEFIRWFQDRIEKAIPERRKIDRDHAMAIAVYDERFCKKNGLVNPFPDLGAHPPQKNQK